MFAKLIILCYIAISHILHFKEYCFYCNYLSWQKI